MTVEQLTNFTKITLACTAELYTDKNLQKPTTNTVFVVCGAYVCGVCKLGASLEFARNTK